MAEIGMQYPVWAPLNSEEGNTLTYGTGMVMGRAVSANLSWQKEDNELYGDDIVAETDNFVTNLWNCGKWVKEQRTLEGQALVGIALLFVLSFAMCIEFENHWRGRFPLFLERMVYIPCSISGMVLLCQLFRHAPSWLLRFLAFVGGISLELYLIHIHFVYKYITPFHLGYCLTALLMIAVSIPLAWLLSKLVDLIVGLLPKEI